MESITGLLQSWNSGDPAALSNLTTLIYLDLHRLASQQLKRERHRQTLQATALVHEAYLRVRPLHHIAWKARAQFLCVMASIMRNVLVDHARERNSLKRTRTEDHTLPDLQLPPDLDVVAVHVALEKLETNHQRAAKVVELRFFGGLDGPECARVLNISLSTAEREWRFARAWLRDEIIGTKVSA